MKRLVPFLFALILSFMSLNTRAETPVEGPSSEFVKALRQGYSKKLLSEKDFVPSTVNEIKRVKGNLNGDDYEDVAIIVQEKAHDKSLTGLDREDDLHEALIIFEGTKTPGLYQVWKISATDLPDSNTNSMEKGFIANLSIKNHVLNIETSTAMSMGGWENSVCTQKWKQTPGGFNLIGLTVTSIDRKCACGTTDDYNYRTGFEIRTSDKGKDGEQLSKPTEKKLKISQKPILFENFNFDKNCSSPE